MPVFNATSFLLYKDTVPIGHSKNVTISIENDLQETTTKDSLGFQELMPTINGGSVQCQGLTAYNDSLNFEQFADYVLTRAEQTFYFKDPTQQEFVIQGTGIVESCNEVSNTEKATEFDLSIKLTGIFTAGDSLNWENIFDQWEDIATNWENT